METAVLRWRHRRCDGRFGRNPAGDGREHAAAALGSAALIRAVRAAGVHPGPGLLVNSLFKDHWGRPRPLQVEQLGGQEHYAPPGYFVANGHGRSFPSGHSSVGFAFIAFWFLLRRHKPTLAKMALLLSLLFGCTIGLTRMAAGGHFLSDVMWSGWVVLFASWLLYYPIMRIPEREAAYLLPGSGKAVGEQ
ncbi:MAG: phosphatase PAP2 family protein [Candidatus Thiothrix singaporensis]|uniref:Phosphatase PAP2 family protein n=1 Tax=Candidatus Thiothrix singaporensis TaxID=2799669 RepID=A0A7L6ATH6_9GAMM|nr:MAG: phosphatase PAP2 family protein [Candidatus Thiothrix singaporensis]